MRIDYPEIEWADVREGDTILKEVADGNLLNYLEFTVTNKGDYYVSAATYYLIDRPKPIMPKESGTFIIAKKVRGIDFPEGIVLRRNKGKDSAYQSVYWISEEMVPDMGQYGRPRYYDRHPESKIEDWVLAKVVPA